MLETIDLKKKVDKQAYKARMSDLSDRLYMVHQRAWEAGIPVIILFEGWDAAGKGTTIHKLTDPIDPRGYKIYPIRAARTYEKKRPWLWRFWLKIPARGEWAIFDRSWYGRVLVERMEKLIDEKDVERYYRDIVDFERALADDGTLILKFFLHISKKEQAKRFKKLQGDRLEAWRVTEEDRRNHKRYKKWLRVYEEMLQNTNTEWGEWTVVEATDKRNTRIRVYETVVMALEERLGIHAAVEAATESESGADVLKEDAAQMAPAGLPAEAQAASQVAAQSAAQRPDAPNGGGKDDAEEGGDLKDGRKPAAQRGKKEAGRA